MLSAKSSVYHKKIPMLMKEKKIRISINPKEGDFQISKGKMGEPAILASQKMKTTRWTMDTIRREYVYGSDHPTAGA